MNREHPASSNDGKVGAFGSLIDAETVSQLLTLSQQFQTLTEPTQRSPEVPYMAGEGA